MRLEKIQIRPNFLSLTYWGRFVSSKWVLPIVLFLFFSGIGVYYAGGVFLANMATSVPKAPFAIGDSPKFMLHGDHFQQLYRFSLPRHNLINRKPLYESGYQYNFVADSRPFIEGWVFFPFSILHIVFGAFLGDILAYNLMALFSFFLVGGAMYWLVFWLTRSHAAALVSSVLVASLPHRTAFLFSQMLYGVDLMWPPLIVLFFEKGLRHFGYRNLILFSVSLFFYATSNFQGLFLFTAFSFPYFVVRALQTFLGPGLPVKTKFVQGLFWVVSLLPAVLYLLYIGELIAASGVSSGQSYAVTQSLSPSFENAFQVWSGNDKTIYLGWPLLMAPLLLVLSLVASHLRSSRFGWSSDTKMVFALSGFVFAVSYLFCFGPNLDSMINIPIFRWYFDNVPGANLIRTPGRLVATTAFFLSLFFGLVLSTFVPKPGPNRHLHSLGFWLFTLLLTGFIIYDYKYTRPLMVELEEQNDAYEQIRGTKGIVFTIPIHVGGGHFSGGTFVYYAQRNNLRLFGGQSSMYPKEWDYVIHDFLPCNEGYFDQRMAESFKLRGITHLVAHGTSFQPNVDDFVIGLLKRSPYLELLAEHNGIYVFFVRRSKDCLQGTQIERFLAELHAIPHEERRFYHIKDWHAREASPNQRPFRWMRGDHSSGIIFASEAAHKIMEFDYRCPREELKITINGLPLQSRPTDLEGDWKKLVIDLNLYGEESFYVEFFTTEVFRPLNDIRELGCAIGDIQMR